MSPKRSALVNVGCQKETAAAIAMI